MDSLCHQCGQDAKCEGCGSDGRVAVAWHNVHQYPEASYCIPEKGTQRCPRCAGTAFDLWHVCCRVVDTLRGGDLRARLSRVLAAPSAEGDSRVISIVSFGPLRERVTGRPLLPVFGNVYLPLGWEGAEDALDLFPRERSRAYVGFAQLARLSVLQHTETLSLGATAVAFESSSDRVVVRESHLTLDARTTWLQVDRVLLGHRAEWFS